MKTINSIILSAALLLVSAAADAQIYTSTQKKQKKSTTGFYHSAGLNVTGETAGPMAGNGIVSAPTFSSTSASSNTYSASSSITGSSQYSSNVTTTADENPAVSSGPRRVAPGGGGSQVGVVEGPIGNTLLPLLIMLLGYAAFRCVRKKSEEA